MNRRPVAAVLALVALLAGGFSLSARSEAPPKPAQPTADTAYLQEIEAWQQGAQRGAQAGGRLAHPGRPLLAEAGENRFGSDPGNPVILPEGKAPAVAGTLIREGDAVTPARRSPGVTLTADGKPVTAAWR